MTAQMLALDLRRGPAPALALAVLVLAGADALGGRSSCESAVLSLRQAMWVVFPCVLAAGVWRGGAARRRGVDEAVRATASPAWRRAAIEGAAVALAGAPTVVLVLAALTVTGCAFGSAAAGVVAVLALAAAAFAGLALGRLLSAPMAAPLILFVVLVVGATFGGWSAGDGAALLLLPGVAEDAAPEGITAGVSAGQALWFAGLAVSGWLLASRRPLRLRLAALAPAAAGLAAVLALA
jgi:hypothetical protein